MLTHELIPAADKESPWLMVVLHGLGDSMEAVSYTHLTLPTKA